MQPLRAVMDEMKDSLADLAPVMKDTLAVTLAIVAELIREFAFELKLMLAPLEMALSIMRKMGLISGGGGLTTSVGAAAREIRFGDPKSFAKEVYQAAYKASAAKGAGKSAVERTAD